MNFIIKNCEEKVQEWLYDLGASEQLPEKYDQFKNLLLEFVNSEGLEDCIKFKDEKWSQYLRRLKLVADSQKIESSEVIKLLRQTPAPRELQSLFFIPDVAMDYILENIEDMEELSERKRNYRKTAENSRNFSRAKDSKNVQIDEEKRLYASIVTKRGTQQTDVEIHHKE